MKKRFLSLLLAITMLFSVTATAFAAEQTGTIKICGTVEGKKYDLYRVFDLTQQGTHFNYTLNPAFTGFFTGKIGGAGQPSTAIGYVNDRETAGTLSQLSQELIAWAITNTTPVKTVTGAATSTTVSDMPFGYYLLNPLGGFGPSTPPGTATMFSLGTLSGNQGECTIKLKALYPTVDKKIVKGAERVDNTDAAIGDKINYEVKSTAPDITGYSKYTYKFTDTMDKGLTFNNDVKVMVNGVEKTSEFEIVQTDTDGVTTITITAKTPLTTFAGIAGKDVVVTYSANLNEHAKIGEANKNGVTLTYSNNPRTEETTTTPKEETKVYTTSLEIFKYYEDADKNKVALAGAKFRITGGNLNIVLVVGKSGELTVHTKGTSPQLAEDFVIETGDDKGHLIFKGLKSGDYTITEIETPNGFAKIDPFEVVITYNNNGTFTLKKGETVTSGNTLKLEVENMSGTELPGTGGIGTTIFYTIGLALVIGSGVAFAVKRKRNI